MRTELVELLIAAHISGDEKAFSEALEKIASEEERKGNTAVSSRLRNAYLKKRKMNASVFGTAYSGSLTGTTVVVSPRDRESLLELFEMKEPETRLSDVVLTGSQRSIIDSIISEQRNMEKFISHNIPPVNRVLLCGPPGCGKTMTAFALAHELRLPLAYVRLDGLVSSYLGQTGTNLRKVFDAVKGRRVLLFLDEFDAIAKKRDDCNDLGELKRVVTTLLQNFDSLSPDVLLVAATNHEHLLDPAVWRRFNVSITLDLPTEEEREILIGKFIEKYDVSGDIDVKRIAKLTGGMCCSAIEELMVSAAKVSLVEGKVETDDVVKSLILQKCRYSDAPDVAGRVCSEMLDNGVSYRTLASLLGLSHSTLQYRVERYRKGLNNERNGKETSSVDSRRGDS